MLRSASEEISQLFACVWMTLIIQLIVELHFAASRMQILVLCDVEFRQDVVQRKSREVELESGPWLP